MYKKLKRSYSSSAPPQSQSTSIVKKRKSRYRTTGTGSVLRRVAALERQVEKKYVISTFVTGGLYDANPLVLLLNPLSRGDTVQSRDGDSCVMGAGFIRGFIQFSAAAFDMHMNPVRAYVILDRESNGTALTTSVLLGTANPTSNSLFNFNNYNFWKRFKLLHDTGHIFPIAPSGVMYNANTPANTTAAPFSFKWDAKQYKSNYAGGNAGDITDIRSGAIYLVVVGSRNSSSTFTVHASAVQYFKET